MNNFNKSDPQIKFAYVQKVNLDGTVDVHIPDTSEVVGRVPLAPTMSSYSSKSSFMPSKGSQCLVIEVGAAKKRYVLCGAGANTELSFSLMEGENGISSSSKNEIRQLIGGGTEITSPSMSRLSLSGDMLKSFSEEIDLSSNRISYSDVGIDFRDVPDFVDKIFPGMTTMEVSEQLVQELQGGFIVKAGELVSLGAKDPAVEDLSNEIFEAISKYFPEATSKNASISAFGDKTGLSLELGSAKIILEGDGSVDIMGTEVRVNGAPIA